tara:strand:- start:2399 stop:2791 length:393 start_codon:yes stop_codon:yes gene_type:complete
MSEKSMIIVQSTWQESQTFRMIPISTDCPYVECIFDPGTKVFVVILKVVKTALHMLPKLDEYGLAITGSKGTKQDRNKIDVFQEFYIEDKTAIVDLIELFGINSKKFDYKSFMEDTSDTSVDVTEKKKTK